MNVNFFGVRGSTPCACRDLARYGGNTACVALEAPGHDPLVLDLGTGLRFWGETQPQDGSFRGSALVTHLHWDHVQGLPFFVPVLRPGARLDVYGPPPEGMSLEAAFREFLRPPFFPVEIDALNGEITFHDLLDDDVVVGDAKVMSRSVPHVGRTAGYRVEFAGVTVAYIENMTVLTAVAMAGGFTHRANTDGFTVTRKVGNKVIEGRAQRNTLVKPGDVIYVHERIL